MNGKIEAAYKFTEAVEDIVELLSKMERCCNSTSELRRCAVRNACGREWYLYGLHVCSSADL